jgi:hypothetical protein
MNFRAPALPATAYRQTSRVRDSGHCLIACGPLRASEAGPSASSGHGLGQRACFTGAFGLLALSSSPNHSAVTQENYAARKSCDRDSGRSHRRDGCQYRDSCAADCECRPGSNSGSKSCTISVLTPAISSQYKIKGNKKIHSREPIRGLLWTAGRAISRKFDHESCEPAHCLCMAQSVAIDEVGPKWKLASVPSHLSIYNGTAL